MQFFIYIIDFDAFPFFFVFVHSFVSFFVYFVLSVAVCVFFRQRSIRICIRLVWSGKHFDLVSLIADFSAHRIVRSNFHSTHKNIWCLLNWRRQSDQPSIIAVCVWSAAPYFIVNWFFFLFFFLFLVRKCFCRKISHSNRYQWFHGILICFCFFFSFSVFLHENIDKFNDCFGRFTITNRAYSW